MEPAARGQPGPASGGGHRPAGGISGGQSGPEAGLGQIPEGYPLDGGAAACGRALPGVGQLGENRQIIGGTNHEKCPTPPGGGAFPAGDRRPDRRRPRPRPHGVENVPQGGAPLHHRRVHRQGGPHHRQVHRRLAAGGDRHRHPAHRPGPPAHRRAGHRQELAVRAPGRRHHRRLHQGGPGHGGHHRGADPLLLELRHAYRQGALP